MIQDAVLALGEFRGKPDQSKLYEDISTLMIKYGKLDMGNIDVAFESSYEPTGPFGAKSIGEIVINTPAPAICNAISNAVGVRIRELPSTPVKVLKGIMENNK